MTKTDTICGLKLTHDSAVAVIADGTLLFCTEAEKVANSRRHGHFADATAIIDEIAAAGVDPAAIGAVAIDGWTPRPDGSSYVELAGSDGRAHQLGVAGYEDTPVTGPALVEAVFGDGLPLPGLPAAFASYPHSFGHLFASYCTSPYAQQQLPALGIVWDGGMPPVLYHVDPRSRRVRRIGRMSTISGGLYPIFASHFDPLRVDRRGTDPQRPFGMEALLPVSGKAMAYASYGKPDEAAIAVMEAVTEDLAPDNHIRMFTWTGKVLSRLAALDLPTATVLASFEQFMFRQLLSGLTAATGGDRDLAGLGLCLSGGCHLNIKWNAGLRGSGLFSDVWVPPFPNDAGSAIGAACTEMVRATGNTVLQWSEFSGPELRWDGALPTGWTARACDIDALAALLHRENEPVVVLTGRAELGPRALGHRSIIAPATDATMRDRLNRIKGREDYRPVAPICLLEHSAEVFTPGGRDPYMIFDHHVREEWRHRIPAVVHVDGSARLQTVERANSPTYELLLAYHRRSGVPVLCNTSANHPGRGFFPDPGSAMRWGGTKYVWSEGVLYTSAG